MCVLYSSALLLLDLWDGAMTASLLGSRIQHLPDYITEQFSLFNFLGWWMTATLHGSKSLVVLTTHVSTVSSSAGLSTREKWICWSGSRVTTNVIWDTEYLCCEDRLRKLGFFSLEKKRHQGGLLVAFQYLKGACKEDGDRLFNNACCGRTMSNGFTLKGHWLFFTLER